MIVVTRRNFALYFERAKTTRCYSIVVNYENQWNWNQRIPSQTRSCTTSTYQVRLPEFRAQHFQLIDYLEEEDELSEVLDQTDDDIATMRFRRWTTPTDTDERGRKIADEDERGRRIINSSYGENPAIDTWFSFSFGAALIWLNNNYEEQLNDIKSNLNTTHSDLLSLEIEDTDELYTWV